MVSLNIQDGKLLLCVDYSREVRLPERVTALGEGCLRLINGVVYAPEVTEIGRTELEASSAPVAPKFELPEKTDRSLLCRRYICPAA